MKGSLALCLLAFLLFVGAKPVAAHQPRIVSGQTVKIKAPQVSQAFYAILQGSPDEYTITAEHEFDLYLSLLVPDLPGIRKDYLLKVYRVDPGGQMVQLSELEGVKHTWKEFYEPFAGDNYFQGPEIAKVLPAGDYRVHISNPDNEGKYVLSVGREESFTLSEAVQTIQRLPSVKKYFEKSPLTAYFNLVGLFMGIALLLLTAFGFGLYRVILFFLKGEGGI